VLADDGTLWLNLGDCYATGAGRVGDAPGGGTQGERWRGGHEGKHGQVGPMTQPNLLPITGFKPKDLVGIPWRVAFALQADGWFLRSDIIWAKPNPMPESVTDRPTKAHEYLFLLAKSERYFYDAAAIQERAAGTNEHDVSGGFASAPGQKPQSGSRRGNKVRKLGDERARPGSHLGGSVPWEGFTRNKRTVWTVTTEPYSGAHFAVMPTALVEPCIAAGSSPGDVVLDPFMGSGTVAQVAQRLGRRWIGCELNPEYHKLIARRTAQTGFALHERTRCAAIARAHGAEDIAGEIEHSN